MKLTTMRGVCRGIMFFAASLAVISNGVRAGQESPVSRIRTSLAFIDVQTPCDTCNELFGSGFIVWEDDGSTYVATAAHVLGSRPPKSITVFLSNNTGVEFRGRLVFKDELSDVAVIGISRAPQADIAHLVSVPPVGSRVYSVGYGIEALNHFLKESVLAPSVTLGAVQRVDRDGRFVSTSRSERGQSGGPIVNEAGDVVGMVLSKPVFGSHDLSRSNVAYYGVSSAKIAAVLGKKHVPYQGDFTRLDSLQNRDEDVGRASGPIREAADAGRLAVAVHVDGAVRYTGQDSYSLQSVSTTVQGAMMHFLQEHARATVVQGYIYGSDDRDVARTASANHAAGAIIVDAHVNVGEPGPFTNRLEARVDVWVVGGRDQIWFHDRETYEKQRYFAFGESETVSQVSALIGSALRALQDEMGGESGYENLARYGVPVASGARASFVRLVLGNRRLQAVSVGSAGSAGISGVRNGDVITHVNGKRVEEFSQEEIDGLLRSSRDVTLTILGADGRAYTATFAPETIRWYVDHGR